MDMSIWALWYDIAAENKAEYLHWFHGVHIPEKLARPGYLWAAHYELGHGARGKGYLALFGGENTHTFLNPGPAQLSMRQGAETKRMMAMRKQSAMRILTEEARVNGPDAATRSGMTSAPVVQMGNFNAPSPQVEDDLGSFYAQERFPLMAKLPGCVGTRKLVATVGAYKHSILYEFTSLAMREQHYARHEDDAHNANTWMGRVVPQLNHAPYSPAVGIRLWPVVMNGNT